MDGTAEGLQAADLQKKQRRAPKLREASFEDHAQIVQLESRYGLAGIQSSEEWSHLWLGDPAYRELQSDWPIGWVLEDENHRIVGSMGNIPLWYELGGRKLLVSSGHAWVAEPEYRSTSLLLLDHVINQRHVDLYLNNTVSVASTPGVCAFGCQRVPVGVWDEQAFWITGYRDVVGEFLARKHYPLATLLSYPLSAAVHLRERLTQPALEEADVEVQDCPAFDERFDDFWDELRLRNPNLLLGVRTREVLEWHFKYALLGNRLWIGTVVDGPRVVAYALFERAEIPTSPLRVVRVVDFQSLDGSTALLVPLLSWALRKCRAEGIHKLLNVGRWLEKGELLDTLAPYRRKLSGWTYYYRANSPGLAERLRDPRAWAPSAFDGDATLVQPVSV